jgi:hypothetical protein
MSPRAKTLTIRRPTLASPLAYTWLDLWTFAMTVRPQILQTCIFSLINKSIPSDSCWSETSMQSPSPRLTATPPLA